MCTIVHKNTEGDKLSITSPTAANTLPYKKYNNKLNSIKRKAERDYFSNVSKMKSARL